MGDRANVKVMDSKFSEPPVYLYTHWGGTELPELVHAALSRKERWEDGPYLARIIFSAMIAGDMKGTTGFGIWCSPMDTGPIVVLDSETQTIGLEGTVKFEPIPMSDFVADPAQLFAAYRGDD